MPNSYQIYICSVHACLHVCQIYICLILDNLHIYQVSCLFIHISRFIVYMFTKLCPIHIDQFLAKYMYQYPCHILHRSSFIPTTCIPCLPQFTQASKTLIITIIPKFKFRVNGNNTQVSSFHIMPSILPNTYIQQGNIPIFPPYSIARKSQFRPKSEIDQGSSKENK